MSCKTDMNLCFSLEIDERGDHCGKTAPQSLIREGVDRIALCRAQSGINGARDRTQDRQQYCADDPGSFDFHLKGWRSSMQNRNDSVGTQQSEGHAQGYHDQRLADDHPANFKARINGFNSGRFDEVISVLNSAIERILYVGSNLTSSLRTVSVSPLLRTKNMETRLSAPAMSCAVFKGIKNRAPLPCNTIPEMVKSCPIRFVVS